MLTPETRYTTSPENRYIVRRLNANVSYLATKIGDEESKLRGRMSHKRILRVYLGTFAGALGMSSSGLEAGMLIVGTVMALDVIATVGVSRTETKIHGLKHELRQRLVRTSRRNL